jgi:hypothetical protein
MWQRRRNVPNLTSILTMQLVEPGWPRDERVIQMAENPLEPSRQFPVRWFA